MKLKTYLKMQVVIYKSLKKEKVMEWHIKWQQCKMIAFYPVTVLEQI